MRESHNDKDRAKAVKHYLALSHQYARRTTPELKALRASLQATPVLVPIGTALVASMLAFFLAITAEYVPRGLGALLLPISWLLMLGIIALFAFRAFRESREVRVINDLLEERRGS